MDIARVGLPVTLGFFIVFLLALPLLRLRARTGIWAVVIRESQENIEGFVRWATIGLLGGVAAWTILYPLLGPAALDVWRPPKLLPWLGAAFMAVGFVVVLIAQAQMGASWRIGIDDRPTALITHGLFARVRNPIYTGIFAMFAGIVFMTPGPWTISAFVLAFVLIAIQTRLEERHLRRLHGDAFASWAARVGRFLPGIGTRPGYGARSTQAAPWA